MGITANNAVCRGAVHEGIVHQSDGKLCGQNTQHCQIHIRVGDPALVVGFLQIIKRRRGQVHIQACFQTHRLGLPVCVDHLMSVGNTFHSAVVGNHEAFKAPFIPEDLRQQTFVAGAGHTLPAVISCHNRQGAAFLEALFERL